jgi:outer membrane protein, heavy metal efflux system
MKNHNNTDHVMYHNSRMNSHSRNSSVARCQNGLTGPPRGFAFILMALILMTATLAAPAIRGGNAMAQDAPAEMYPELEVYVQMALENNPELKALDYLYRSEAERSRESGVLPDPELGISYDFNPMMSESIAGRFSVSVMQMFPWFGTLQARRDMQMASAGAERAAIDIRRLELLQEVRMTWFDIVEMHHHIDVTWENLQLLGELEKLVETRYVTARAGQADILRIQMEEERIRTRLADQEGMLNALTSSFNALLNRNPAAEVFVPDDIVRKDYTYSVVQARSLARSRNPVFENLSARETELRMRDRIARLDGRPSFGLGLEVMGRDFGPMSMNPEAKESFIGMATIRLPIYRGRTRSQQRQVGEELRAIDQLRGQAENRLDADLSVALEDTRRYDRAIRLMEVELIPRAEQALEILREEYASGNVRFDELLQIQRELLDLEMDLVEAIAGQNRAVVRMETLMGSDGLTDAARE